MADAPAHPAPRPRPRFTVQRAMVVSAVVSVVAYGFTPRWRRTDFTGVPLEKCEFLRDVAEPIRIDESLHYADGGSVGLIFTDAKGVPRAVCLNNDLFEYRNLTLGSAVPLSGRAVPIRGEEERAFLGLLQRWARTDPEGRSWLGRVEDRSRAGPHRGPITTGGETPQQLAKLGAVTMIVKLQRRN